MCPAASRGCGSKPSSWSVLGHQRFCLRLRNAFGERGGDAGAAGPRQRGQGPRWVGNRRFSTLGHQQGNSPPRTGLWAVHRTGPVELRPLRIHELHTVLPGPGPTLVCTRLKVPMLFKAPHRVWVPLMPRQRKAHGRRGDSPGQSSVFPEEFARNEAAEQLPHRFPLGMMGFPREPVSSHPRCVLPQGLSCHRPLTNTWRAHGSRQAGHHPRG